MKKYDAIYMGYEKDNHGYVTKFVISNHIHSYCVGRFKSKFGWLAHSIHFVARYSELSAFLIAVILGGTVNVRLRVESDGLAVYRREL